MKNYKYFFFILVFIGILVSSCQNIIKPQCYITLTNQASQQVDYADVWLVAKKDSTKRVKLFEFEKLETSDTSSVYSMDFSKALSKTGYIEVNVKLQGNPKTFQSRIWEYEGHSYYFDLPVPGTNLLIFSVNDDRNYVSSELAKYKKGRITQRTKSI